MNTNHGVLSLAASVLLATSLFSAVSFADDASVRKGLEAARGLFNQRSTNLVSTNEALRLLESLEDQADDSDLNYDVLILESRALYWNGEHTSDSGQKRNIYLQGNKKALAAKEINDSYADAFYYAGINLARWAEATGIFESIGRKGELFDLMSKTMERNTRDGKSGEDIDGDGPNRVFGRVYFKLPGILGGSRNKSLEYLNRALEQSEKTGDRIPLNVVYLAETLSTGNSADKDQARNMLDRLLREDPNTYNPRRVPESKDEFELARQLRSQL